ncbi:MAG: polar amino acid transport system permease protein [Actinomycetota bacterium]|nr:polar amino acid transport system permease protein [Actinomycetota bacterium]
MAAHGDAAAATAQYVPSPEEQRRREVRRRQARKHTTIAAVSTVVVLGALAAIVVMSPGWARVQQTFFDVNYAVEVLPAVAKGLLLNIKLTIIGSVAIAALGLTLALVRTSSAAPLAPFRVLATVYVDVFRGVPTLLVILLVGFGVPALRLTGITTSVVVLGTTAVVLTYSAYVAEVLRSGILSVHPSQTAAARSLGLTSAQTLRYVVLPQGIRRVIPPLMNDFVSLLKDTGLISVLGVVDAIRAAQIESSKTFNYTPYVVAAILFLLLTIPLTRVTDRVLATSIARQNSQASP